MRRRWSPTSTLRSTHQSAAAQARECQNPDRHLTNELICRETGFSAPISSGEISALKEPVAAPPGRDRRVLSPVCRSGQPLVGGQLLLSGGRLREQGLPPEPCTPTNAEARLHGTVFFAVLPRRPDEHAADEDERDEHEHQNDDLCSRHCNSVAAKPGLPAEPLSEHPSRT
jgi:hypothetical protein